MGGIPGMRVPSLLFQKIVRMEEVKDGEKYRFNDAGDMHDFPRGKGPGQCGLVSPP